MPRPRVLDEGKQREVCALLTAGMTMNEAAAYVGCCEKTIRREQRRDEDFDERVRRARMAARLGPLQAVREAAATHWRAAAWLVDRQDRQEERERRARREQAKRKRQQAKAKRKQPPWNPEREIQQIASARPSAGAPTPPATSPRRHPADAAPLPAHNTSERPSPVAAAMRELAKQVAATVDKPDVRGADGAPTRRTKPAVGLAAGTGAEPTNQGPNDNGGDTAEEGFVPSLRVFGQNDEGGEDRAANPVRDAAGSFA